MKKFFVWGLVLLGVIIGLTWAQPPDVPPEGEAVQLTRDPGVDISPAWRPDGKALAFVSNRQGGMHILVVADNCQFEKKLTDTGNNSAPVFSPDGKEIAFVSDRAGAPNIWKMTADGGNPQQLTRFNETEPAWSPDGEWIAFISQRTGAPALWIMRRDGSCQTMLVNVPGKPVARPTWSPDSREILFSGNITGTFDLWACTRDGVAMRQVTTSPKTEESPHRSLQSDLVAFASELTG